MPSFYLGYLPPGFKVVLENVYGRKDRRIAELVYDDENNAENTIWIDEKQGPIRKARVRKKMQVTDEYINGLPISIGQEVKKTLRGKAKDKPVIQANWSHNSTNFSLRTTIDRSEIIKIIESMTVAANESQA